MSAPFEAQSVLVTGASSGIGRAVAIAFAERGASVVIVARRRDALEDLADEIAVRGRERPHVLVADLATRGAARELGHRALALSRRIDVLVNNAGAGIAGLQLDVADDDAARSLFETNYWSPLALASTLFADALETDPFTIVNVTSLISGVPVAMAGHYGSSKAALSLATEAMRLELVGRAAHVLHVMPGPIETPMLDDLRRVRGAAKMVARLPRATPEALAARIVSAVADRRSELVLPRSLAFVRHAPTLMLALARRNARPIRGSVGREVPRPRV